MVFVSGVIQTGFVKAAAVVELSAYDCPLLKIPLTVYQNL